MLTVIVTLDDSGEVSVLPPSASAPPAAAKRRKREAAVALRFPAAAGRALLLSPRAAKASPLRPPAACGRKGDAVELRKFDAVVQAALPR